MLRITGLPSPSGRNGKKRAGSFIHSSARMAPGCDSAAAGRKTRPRRTRPSAQSTSAARSRRGTLPVSVRPGVSISRHAPPEAIIRPRCRSAQRGPPRRSAAPARAAGPPPGGRPSPGDEPAQLRQDAVRVRGVEVADLEERAAQLGQRLLELARRRPRGRRAPAAAARGRGPRVAARTRGAGPPARG